MPVVWVDEVRRWEDGERVEELFPWRDRGGEVELMSRS